jgi:alpha-beta hydrolase superfamily lysophospholipase
MTTLTIPSGDLQLQAAVIAPENPKAVVVFVHGMAEHKERYYPFMTYLCEQGFACVIYDQRGHGATAVNPDDLGYFGKNGVKKLVEDTRTVIHWTRQQYAGLKLFLLGHSMGSMVVRCYTKKYDREIDGLVVCGSPSNNPVAGLGILVTHVFQLFKGERHRSKTVALMMFGPHVKKFKDEGIHNAWLSTNKVNVQEYNDDPLCGFKFTLNGYRVVMQLIRETYSPNGWAVKNPEMPVHFLAGSEDPCIITRKDFDKAVEFFRDRGYKKVSAKVYTGMRHEVLNELGKESVWEDVGDVLKSWL